jgi:hypothetical protein
MTSSPRQQPRNCTRIYLAFARGSHAGRPHDFNLIRPFTARGDLASPSHNPILSSQTILTYPRYILVASPSQSTTGSTQDPMRLATPASRHSHLSLTATSSGSMYGILYQPTLFTRFPLSTISHTEDKPSRRVEHPKAQVCAIPSRV